MQPPDRHFTLAHETPGVGSIDDLTIDIADLHRDVKAQKAGFIDTASARASEDRKA